MSLPVLNKMGRKNHSAGEKLFVNDVKTTKDLRMDLSHKNNVQFGKEYKSDFTFRNTITI